LLWIGGYYFVKENMVFIARHISKIKV